MGTDTLRTMPGPPPAELPPELERELRRLMRRRDAAADAFESAVDAALDAGAPQGAIARLLGVTRSAVTDRLRRRRALERAAAAGPDEGRGGEGKGTTGPHGIEIEDQPGES